LKLKKGNCPKTANLDSTKFTQNVGIECFTSMISLIDTSPTQAPTHIV